MQNIRLCFQTTCRAFWLFLNEQLARTLLAYSYKLINVNEICTSIGQSTTAIMERYKIETQLTESDRRILRFRVGRKIQNRFLSTTTTTITTTNTTNRHLPVRIRMFFYYIRPHSSRGINQKYANVNLECWIPVRRGITILSSFLIVLKPKLFNLV